MSEAFTQPYGGEFEHNHRHEFGAAQQAFHQFVIETQVDTLADFEVMAEKLQSKAEALYDNHCLAGQPVLIRTEGQITAVDLDDEPLEDLEEERALGFIDGFFVDSEVIHSSDLEDLRTMEDFTSKSVELDEQVSATDAVQVRLGVRLKPFFSLAENPPETYRLEVPVDDIEELRIIHDAPHPFIEDDTIIFDLFHHAVSQAHAECWDSGTLESVLTAATEERTNACGLIDRHFELVCRPGTSYRKLNEFAETLHLEAHKLRRADEVTVNETLHVKFIGFDWVWTKSFYNDALGIGGRRPECYLTLEHEDPEDISRYGGRYLQIPMSSILAGIFLEERASPVKAPMDIFKYELSIFSQAWQDFNANPHSLEEIKNFVRAMRDYLLGQSLVKDGEVLLELDGTQQLEATSELIEDEDGDMVQYAMQCDVYEGRALRGFVVTYGVQIYGVNEKSLNIDPLVELDVSADPYFAAQGVEFLTIPMRLVKVGQILSSPRMNMQ